MTKFLPQETERIQLTLEEFTKRLNQCEREKAEALHQLHKTQDRLSKEENRTENERKQLMALQEDLYKRLKRAEREVKDMKEEQVEQLTKFSELERTIQSLNESKSKIKFSAQKELELVTQSFETQIQDLKRQLDQASDIRFKHTRELQNALSEHQRNAEKW
jgi:chromosome segregation ATPase